MKFFEIVPLHDLSLNMLISVMYWLKCLQLIQRGREVTLSRIFLGSLGKYLGPLSAGTHHYNLSRMLEAI